MGWYLSLNLSCHVMSVFFIKTKKSTINYLLNVELLTSQSFLSGASWKVLISADAGGAEVSRGWQHEK